MANGGLQKEIKREDTITLALQIKLKTMKVRIKLK